MNNRYATVQRPEAALQRANDFISVGKEQDALNALYEVLKDRRSRQWNETYEEIMLKHVELCVRLRNTALAKDGLFQYRVFTQQVSVTSLKTVIDRFLNLAEQKTEEAQKESVERVEEIDDLDNADAPENLLLSVVSGAATQDRMDRTVLSPWLRFLWDSYRNCLDMLRNNTLVEEIYHQVVRQSFQFCVKYQRRNEFRKLCDLLRIHLSQIQKSQIPTTEYRQNDFRVKLSSVESLQLMQETRLIQLNTAIEMECWQEAYKSAEDLHNIMQLSKDIDRKMVKPSSYVNYFDKLALVFWKGGNVLFHAAALLQKFSICKDMKKSFTDEEAQDQATRVLLAALTIKDGAEKPATLTKLLDIEDQHLTNIRLLSSLLRLPVAPTRAGLLKEITWLNIPELAVEPARAIYKNLEQDFQPLRLAAQVQKGMDGLEKIGKPEYTQYFGELKNVVASKVLRQLSVIYGSLSLERFKKIIPFFSRVELEHFLVEGAKHQSIKASVSHRDNCVVFSALDLTLCGGNDASGEVEAASNGIEYIRDHLVLLHKTLQDAVYELDGQQQEAQITEKLATQIKAYLYHRDADYTRILSRRKKIEEFKEVSEKQRRLKIQQAQEEYQKREEQKRQDELKRLAEENKENELKRIQAEKDEFVRRQKAEQLRKFQSNPIYQQIIKEKGEDAVQTLDPETVIKEQRDRMNLERIELQNKLKQQEKKFDYMVRAFHLDEVEVYKQKSHEYAQEAPAKFEESEELRIKKAHEDHQRACETFERMNKMRSDAEKFLTQLISTKAEDMERRRRDWQNRLEEERARRLIQRKEDRKRDRQRQAEKEKRETKEREKAQAAQDEMVRAEQERSEHRQMLQRVKDNERNQNRRDGDRGGERRDGDRPWSRDRQRDVPQGESRTGAYVPPSRRPNDDTGRSDMDNNWRAGPRAPPPSEPRGGNTYAAPRRGDNGPPAEPRSAGAYVPPGARRDNRDAPPPSTGAYIPPNRR